MRKEFVVIEEKNGGFWRRCIEHYKARQSYEFSYRFNGTVKN